MLSFFNQKLGLGLRQEFIEELAQPSKREIDFLEIAPENWMKKGGGYRKSLREISQYYPLIAHGLSLSIGGPAPLDVNFLKELKDFFDEFNINIYSEHLSFSLTETGNLYELLPMPFTVEAAEYVARRIKKVEETLERPLIIENPSYYVNLNAELSEVEFIKAVLEFSGAKMLLDINNVFVNSQNHDYCPKEFIDAFTIEDIFYLHIAGHSRREEIIIDTHGSEISLEVYELLSYFYQTKGLRPTVLERDSDIPPLQTLLNEMQSIKNCMKTKKSLYPNYDPL